MNVIPASEARRESFREARKDSGQAGMTKLRIAQFGYKLFIHDIFEAIKDIEIFLGEIDYEIIWNVIKEKLPEIKPAIEAILKDLTKNTNT